MANRFLYTGKEELDQARFLPGYNKNIVRQLMKVAQSGQVLMDFGAGIGTISELVRDHVTDGSIICLEIDASNIETLKSKGFNVIDDIAKCPDESIDVVYSSNVLEHIEDDVAALKDIFRTLRPGGYVSFWVPAWKILWTKMDDRVGHYRRYRRPLMIDTFKAAGFEPECCYYQDCLGVPVTLLFKLIGDKDGRVSEGSLKFYDNVISPVSQMLDFGLRHVAGKNLVMHARKPL